MSAFQINTNTPALGANRNLNNVQRDIQTRIARLSTASRINSAADDAAGLAISDRLNALSSGLDQSLRNIQDSVSLAQVAGGGVTSINKSVQRIRQLSVQASNGTLNDQDRASIQKEVNQLKQGIDQISQSASFNGKKLLDGSLAKGNGSLNFQVGPDQGSNVNVNISALSTASLGINGLDVSTQAGAQTAITSSDSAINTLSSTAADIGALTNRLQQSFDFTGIARENSLAAQSQIKDANLASETSALVRDQILGESGTAALAQANLVPQNVLSLIQ